MEYFYYKALLKIKELSGIPSETEWNVIAKFENYLTAESIKYISKKNFKELCAEIRNM